MNKKRFFIFLAIIGTVIFATILIRAHQNYWAIVSITDPYILGVQFLSFIALYSFFLIERKRDGEVKVQRKELPRKHSIILKSLLPILIVMNIYSSITEKPDYTKLIFRATANDDVKKVEYVLKKDAGLASAFNKNRRTPLHIAAYKGNISTAKLLITNGASLEARDHEGITPLHMAIFEGHKEVVQLLIENGANVNVKAKEKLDFITPLYGAVALEKEDIVSQLIKNGADVNAKDAHGRTILELAKAKNNTKIIEILHNNGSVE